MKKQGVITTLIIIGVIALIFIYAKWYAVSGEDLAAMIRVGNAYGVASVLKAHPKLVNANISSRSNLKPLHEAASCGQLSICRILIESGADVNVHNEAGQTPLHFAFVTPGSNVAAILLQNGAKASAEDMNHETPLHVAAYAGNTNDIILLLQYGADLTIKTSSGKTPLDYAKEFGKDKDVLRMLTDAMRKATNSQELN